MSDFDPASFRAMTIDGYDVADGVFTAHYTLRGNVSDDSHDVSFAEVVDFGAALGERRPDDRLLRLLALTCSPSYFKAAAPPRLEIAFPTGEFERHYLRELIAGGLGEFAYRNSLPDALTPEVTGPDAPPADVGVDGWDADAEPLVPVGGGKDSVVSIEALKRHGFHPTLFSVNKFDPIDRCIAISGLDSLRVMRRIDPRLIEANAEGAHNGHVPVTAINSVIGLIVADANGLGPVVLSNERSSNVGNVTWLGRDVNHQWSKSISYESLLRDTLTAYGLNPDRYFSLLRPLSESEIADRFREQPRVLPRLHQLQPPIRDRLGPPGRHVVRALPEVSVRLRPDGATVGTRGGRGDLRSRSVRRPGQSPRLRGHRRSRRAQAIRVRRRVLRGSRVAGVGPRRRRVARRSARRGVSHPA